MSRILIIGGGVAGTAAALALHRAGREPVIFEAHPQTAKDIGAFLILASNGMRALTQIDAADAVAAAGFQLTGMQILDATGAEVAKTPLGESSDPLAAYRCLRRAELNRALQAEVQRRGIEIRHGARLESVTEDASGVTAVFADGSTATGDLLIGADGLNSTTRSLIDAAEPGPHYAGQQVFYGYTTEAAPPSEPERITMIRGSAAAFGYTVSPTGETFWFARVSGEAASAQEIAETTPAQWRDRLVPLLSRDATPAAAIVAATGTELMVTNAWDLPLGVRWSTDRTVLIGDAAHAASPASGQGASMALEDAVVLAKALRDSASIGAALATYDRLRRSRVERNIVVSGQLTGGAPAQAPAQDRQGPERRASGIDEELARLLEWDLPLDKPETQEADVTEVPTKEQLAQREAEYDRFHNATDAQGSTFKRLRAEAWGEEHCEEVDPSSSCSWSLLGDMIARLRLAPGEQLVDLGCGRGGTGLWLARAFNARLTGVDVSQRGVEISRRRAPEFLPAGRAEFRRGTFEQTGLPSACADGVVSMDALPFAFDRDTALTELRRILRPGARAVFTAVRRLPEHPSYDAAETTWPERISRAGLELEAETEYPELSGMWGHFYAGLAEHEAEVRAEMGKEGADLLYDEVSTVGPVVEFMVELLFTVRRPDNDS
ncbi:FAD-dependent monooxygenase [Actinospica sp.]|uniref:FAD-dependent monooxygenase n=1 Tax=Actinospica sp. TaxID=1872142 RepID=UPI002C9BA257|nr:FAD-dependent monooxygenase [Actinospica sp.]HWG26221.1 FAD-dependent monooxygenase [Actinospica sp.]